MPNDDQADQPSNATNTTPLPTIDELLEAALAPDATPADRRRLSWALYDAMTNPEPDPT